jgi:sugar phosphate isomerase/epimerase
LTAAAYNWLMIAGLSISVSGLERGGGAPWDDGPRAAIQWAADSGFSGITLDGTMPGLRARELDRSARRDLAALLRRLGLRFDGIDLWIPPEHYADPARAERARAALLQAIDLGAEVARAAGAPRPVVHTCFGQLGADLADAINGCGDRAGVRIAAYGLLPAGHPEDPLGWGVDPAASILAGAAPDRDVLAAGSRLRGARLSDACSDSRVTPGSREGRLDVQAYLAALAAVGFRGPVTLDLRALPDQPTAARRAAAWWSAAAQAPPGGAEMREDSWPS